MENTDSTPKVENRDSISEPKNADKSNDLIHSTENICPAWEVKNLLVVSNHKEQYLSDLEEIIQGLAECEVRDGQQSPENAIDLGHRVESILSLHIDTSLSEICSKFFTSTAQLSTSTGYDNHVEEREDGVVKFAGVATGTTATERRDAEIVDQPTQPSDEGNEEDVNWGGR